MTYKTTILHKLSNLVTHNGGSIQPMVFENRSLRKITEPKLYKVTGGLIKPHKDRLYNMYSLPNIIMVVKTRRKNLAGHVTWMGYRPAYRL